MTLAVHEQRALVDRLMSACGGSYSPEIRRRFFISGPQWAAAYRGQALFHAPTREPLEPADVIRHFSEIGIEGNKELWTLHELISHRLFQILIGQHRGRTFVDMKP